MEWNGKGMEGEGKGRGLLKWWGEWSLAALPREEKRWDASLHSHRQKTREWPDEISPASPLAPVNLILS